MKQKLDIIGLLTKFKQNLYLIQKEK